MKVPGRTCLCAAEEKDDFVMRVPSEIKPHHQPPVLQIRTHKPLSSPVLEFGQSALKALSIFMALAIFWHRVSSGYG